MLASLTPVLLFIAFLLLLLVSLSVPIIKTIFLFRIAVDVSSSLLSSEVTGSVKFGVWGYCSSGIDVSLVGHGSSTAASCSKAKLGYSFDSAVSDALHIRGQENIISKALTAALVLHPIATGLTFLALLISLFILRRGSNGTSRLPSLLTLGAGLIAALITTIAFLIDVILVAIARNKVKDLNEDVSLVWGNAVWMVLSATVALWLAMVGACAGICACAPLRRRRTRKSTDGNKY